MRLLLDNPDFADQVPIDLSRWNDWSVLDRLVEMYKRSDKNAYIRQPVVSYLTVASEQPGDVGKRATTALEELEKLDPDGVKQARSLAAFGALARARAGTPTTEAADATAENAGDANATVARAAATDATHGFGATAEDVAAEAESQPGDIPDPTEFEAQTTDSAEPPVTNQTAERQKEQADPQIKTAVEPAAVAESNRPLLIGVPLVAAVVLMGVYWAILRFGAV
jgi:hypothetical protein